MVQNVKELGAKLNIERLGNSSDRIVLEERKIQIRQPWSDQRLFRPAFPARLIQVGNANFGLQFAV